MTRSVILALGVLFPMALAQMMDPQKAILHLSFLALDGNKDGRVSSGEFRDYFEVFDTNKDGAINFDEYVKNTHLPPDIAGPLFNHFDSDHSKAVTLETEGMAAFRVYDADGDHYISEGEFFHEQTILFKLVSGAIDGVNPVG